MRGNDDGGGIRDGDGESLTSVADGLLRRNKAKPELFQGPKPGQLRARRGNGDVVSLLSRHEPCWMARYLGEESNPITPESLSEL
jgi:hypothetical protein